MGCCGCSLRATAIFAAIFSLLQGSAWIGLAIWGLTAYGCQGDPTFPDTNINIANGGDINGLVNAIGNIMYMVYFYNVDCKITRPSIEIELEVAPEVYRNVSVGWLPSNTPIVERTKSWMMAYAILSGIWILASIVLLIAAIGNKKGKGPAALYYPWILVMLTIVVADVAATIIFLLDMNNTWGVKPFLVFIGVDVGNPTLEPYWNNWDATSSGDIVFTIPSIIMGVVFSRFFVFWLTNLILLIYVLQAAIQVGKSQRKTKERYHDPQPGRNPNQDQSRGNDQWLYSTPPVEAQARPTSPNPHQEQQLPQRFQPQESFAAYPQQHVQSQQKPVQQHVQPVRMPQQQPVQDHVQPMRTSQQQPPQQQYFAPMRPSYSYEPRVDYDNNAFVSDEPVRQRFVPPSNQGARNSYQSAAGPSGRVTPTAPVARNESLESRKSNSAAPNELRSQLPWSYTQSRDDPAVLHVNKQAVIREDDEYLPPIPVPDYTLHFPKRPRGDAPAPNPKPQKSALKGRNELRY